ncbi:MAG TPA: U32 family peptidase, partial [Pseudobdellovibrionaceae bacterium]|nr:U32 family peptidase [Pseudobdellovibrionaceae bacterium]
FQVLHGSTQMTVTNSEAIELLEDLKIKRFVLGRENSLEEIRQIRQKTNKDLEVFVHGALCVAYSGQCFTSESLGGRSANRGQCAQSCRLGYDLIVDGKKKDLGEKKYLLSPQDLCGLDEIPELMDLGITSFKVEGRLKSVDYVATAAREYRKAIDAHTQGVDLTKDQTQQSRLDLGTAYSRGFYRGWLRGVQHQELVNGTFSAHRGSKIGRIEKILKNEMRLILDFDMELFAGDGLLWAFKDQGSMIEEGAQIYEALRLRPREYALRFANKVDLSSKLNEAFVYLNHSTRLTTQVQKSVTDKSLLKKINVDIEIHLALGEKPQVKMRDGIYEVKTQGSTEVALAEKKAVSDDFLREELGALGGTVFQAQKIEIFRESEAPL